MHWRKIKLKSFNLDIVVKNVNTYSSKVQIIINLNFIKLQLIDV